jgi:murein DD-endopeptidase MepM/ murein hydrolase activator NlpD
VADRPDTVRKRIRLGPTGVRRLRIAAASSFVVLTVLGGAAALWLTTRTSDPTPAASRAERPSAPPPIRLDTLPQEPLPEPTERTRTPSRAGSEGRSQTGEGGEQRREENNGSRSDMRREIAALAQENARVQALLSSYNGRGSGTGELVRPVEGRSLLRFGWLWGNRHAGTDIAARAGTPVYAADWGRVVISGAMGGYGKLVCIQHTRTLSTCYAHNSRLRVRKGESVGSGDVIAKSGCTGRCYAPHVHFEVRVRGRAVNPNDYL